MYSFLLKLKRRIKKLLKVQSESRQLPNASFQSRTFKFLMLVIVAVLVGVLYPGESLYDPLDMPRKGEISIEDIIAPFQITIKKTDRELKDEIEATKLSVPYIIDYDTSIANNAYRSLERFFKIVDSLKKKNPSPKQKQIDEEIKVISSQFPLLSQTAIIQSLKKDDLKKVYESLKEIYQKNIYKIGVLSDQFSLPKSVNKNVLIRHGEIQNIYSRNVLYPVATANLRLLTALNKLNATDSIDVEYYYLIGRTFIQPNLRVNMKEYEKRLNESLASISNIKEIVNAGDIIIRSGHRVSERQARILNEMARILHNRAAHKGWWQSFFPLLARIILVFAVFSCLYLFLYFFRRDLFKSNPKLLAMFLVFAIQLFLVHLLSVRWELSMYLYPIVLLPILTTILFDAEVGVLSTVILALLLGIMNRFDFTLVLMTTVIGIVACFTSQHVRRRSHFFRIMYSTAFAYLIFIFLVETLKLSPQQDILTLVTYGLVNGIITPILALGILPVFESIFGITTDITLLELSDLNHPLLKRLALETPGTYHHSISVGNLSEAATKAIGGNSLLARVGAYFHDIGKIEIPEYFVENQLSLKSKHDDLTPSMSSVILSSHVKKGRILGEEAGIPDDVLNFIEEHHGTMVQSYFYNKAIEQGADKSIADKFRYPGPKPQTKETGVTMLADAVEAASRTLDDPKPARIRNLIQRIINDRFQSGELDECPLTIRDLTKIKEAFVQILIGTFHHRIVYPKKDKTEEE